MKKIEAMPMSAWLKGESFEDYQPKKTSPISKPIVILGAVTVTTALVTLTLFPIDGMAMTPDAIPVAGTGIEVGGRKLYAKITGVGKWIIMLKGSFDIIKHVTSSEYDQAKKVGIQHILVFSVLLGMPWAFDMVEDVFASGM